MSNFNEWLNIAEKNESFNQTPLIEVDKELGFHIVSKDSMNEFFKYLVKYKSKHLKPNTDIWYRTAYNSWLQTVKGAGALVAARERLRLSSTIVSDERVFLYQNFMRKNWVESGGKDLRVVSVDDKTMFTTLSNSIEYADKFCQDNNLTILLGYNLYTQLYIECVKGKYQYFKWSLYKTLYDEINQRYEQMRLLDQLMEYLDEFILAYQTVCNELGAIQDDINDNSIYIERLIRNWYNITVDFDSKHYNLEWYLYIQFERLSFLLDRNELISLQTLSSQAGKEYAAQKL